MVTKAARWKNFILSENWQRTHFEKAKHETAEQPRNSLFGNFFELFRFYC